MTVSSRETRPAGSQPVVFGLNYQIIKLSPSGLSGKKFRKPTVLSRPGVPKTVDWMPRPYPAPKAQNVKAWGNAPGQDA